MKLILGPIVSRKMLEANHIVESKGFKRISFGENAYLEGWNIKIIKN